MKMISSSSNELLKSIRKLKNRKERQERGNYYIEGIRLIGEALRTGAKVQYLIVCPELVKSEYGQSLISQAENSGIEIIQTSPEAFSSIAMKEGPQGLAAVVAMQTIDLDEVIRLGGIWLALDSIQDPGNLGSVMRSLDGMGGSGIIILDESTDPFHPTSARASTGALFTQKIIITSSRKFFEWKHKSRVHLVGTSCAEAVNYRKYNYPQNMILLLGSEQKGLPQDYLANCDGVVTIPLHGSVDSLNLACAASIILFEIKNQKTLVN